MAAMIKRKSAETLVPTAPPTASRFGNRLRTALAPSAIATVSAKTMVE
jgi:hypothetical protein